LLTFEDCADIGDGWFHGQAVNDQTFVSTGSQAAIALVHNSPLLTTFRVQVRMNLPREFVFDGMTRSSTMTELIIDNYVTLRPGSDHLEVETTIENHVDDHRLRVLFPSGATTDSYLADSAFDVVRRPIALRDDNHLYRELELETKPQNSWTAVHDTQRGLAIISTGLKESAVRDLPERPIALTLYRSTRRTVNTDGEPEGQLHQKLSFRYWILPLSGEPNVVYTGRLAQQLAAGLRTVQLHPMDLVENAPTATYPPIDSFLRVAGEVLLTSARQVGRTLEVRLYNPTDSATVADIYSAFKSAESVNFESESAGESLTADNGVISVTVKAKGIVTLALQS
jgi:alpha-mannosidase/mannosylglycerate hydrolase